MATIEGVETEVLLTKQIVTETKTKVDNLTLFVEAYQAMTNENPLTITLSDGVTQVDNLKKSSDKVALQIDNFLSADSTKVVTYSDSSTSINLAKMAENAGANIDNLALIDSTGDGSQYLTNDGTYKSITSGVQIDDTTPSTTTVYSSSKTDEKLATKQATLVNQTNIKSINGNSLLGSGDLTIQSGDHTNTTTQKPTIFGEDLILIYDSENGNLPKLIKAGLLGVSSSTFNDTDPFGDGSLKNYYKLEDNTIDTMGAYNASATNITYTTGKVGKSGVFNDTAYATASHGLSTAFSFCFWMKNGSGDCHLSSFGTNIFTFLTGKLGFYSAGTQFLTATISTNNTSTWYFITFTYDGTTLKLYIDGVLDSSAIVSLNISATTFGFGANADGSNKYIGELDQIRLFNRALTLEEHQAIRNEEI